MTGRWMMGLAIAALLAGGCTKDNPHACAEGDPCTDPARPFCDLDGLVAGVPGACIAVSCTPGDFAACDSDRAIQCNATGDNYDTVLCERGCDPASDGCRLCNPNETACTNGVTATCDASGAVVSMEPCALGCFESEPRCRDVDPSNGLAQYLDMTRTAPVLLLTGNARASTITGNVIDGEGMPIAVPSILMPAPPGGAPVRVFIVRSAAIEHLTFDGPQIEQETPAAAIVSHGEIRITGVVDLTPTVPRVAPGSRLAGACVGPTGSYEMLNGSEYVAGSGGGGGATPGGRGGRIDILNTGTPGGMQGPTVATLEPLIGGCAGGGGGSSGGGALQLVSRTAVTFAPSAGIHAGGAGGLGDQGVVGGGGAGGSILIEAPSIVLGGGVAVTANGGSGATGAPGGTGTTGGTTTTPTAAPGCGSTPATRCGVGGAGGAQGGPPSNGGDLVLDGTNGIQQLAGGGGGSVGRVRLNTANGTYVRASDAIESPAPSTGTLRTR
jgi:hypothetical protein